MKTLPAALPLALGCLAACISSREPPPPDEPVVGKILEERIVYPEGGELQVDLERAIVMVPPFAAPSGTRLLLRLVGNVPFIQVSGPVAGTPLELWHTPASFEAALQLLLPAGVALDQPLMVSLLLYGQSINADTRVLHARETENIWTVDAGQIPQSSGSFTFAMGEPGLWTLGLRRAGSVR
jgi:hypothetical protein